MGMDFDKLDIDQMFAEAAGAAENTGEKDPENYSKNPPKAEVKVETKSKKETNKAKPESRVEQPKIEQEKPKVERPVEKPKQEPVKDRLGPLLKQNDKKVITDGLNVDLLAEL